MNGTLIPTAWRTFSAATGPVSAAWGPWFFSVYLQLHLFPCGGRYFTRQFHRPDAPQPEPPEQHL